MRLHQFMLPLLQTQQAANNSTSCAGERGCSGDVDEDETEEGKSVLADEDYSDAEKVNHCSPG